MNQLSLHAPNTLGEIYKNSFYVFRHIFGRVFLLCLLGLIVVFVITALLPIQINPKVINDLQYYSTTGNKHAVLQLIKSSNLFWLFIAIFAIIQVVYSYLIIAIINLIGQCCNNEKLKISSSLKQGVYKFFPMLILNIALSIIYGIGIILFYLPFIFAIVLLFAAQIALIIDNKDIISAIKTSAKLVWRRWWLTFGFLLLFGLTYIAIVLFAYFIQMLIVALLTNLTNILSSKIILILSSACGIGFLIIFLAVATWFLCAKIMTYFYLKHRAATK